MSWTRWLLVYVLTFAAFLAIDMVWLGLIAQGFYEDQLGDLMRETVNWPVAIAFYLLYVAGALILVVRPALAAGRGGQALLMGALLGVVAYGTYDLTNLAVLEGFPGTVAVVDTIWGGVLTAATSGIGYLIARRVAPTAARTGWS